MKKIIGICFLLFLFNNYNSQNINGVVYDGEEKTVSGAVIGVEGENVGDITDEKGAFSIDFTNVDKSKNLIAYLGGFEPYRIKVSDYLNNNNHDITLKEKVVNIQQVVLTPQKTSLKNLGENKKSKMRYDGYDSKKDKTLFREFAIKIKNKKHIKIKNININVSDYKIDTPINLVFDIYSIKNDLPNESLISETLSKEISNEDIKNNVISLDVSDKNIWLDEDFFVSVRTANDFKGYIYFSGNIFAFSQKTYYRVYYGDWKEFSSGAPSINLDVLIKK
ncbi:carboxypeptidase-like regulatory domain-containing protein [Chryseobacterium sp. JK1]|uniref:carboxypeptidase-like regulatory domain-containing protein n=1 Tax=Chryseobacterium sp. JK1 TaxID=874294 RepID=UPI003D696058